MSINIKLTKDEAIVLFEFLKRFDERENQSKFEDQSEERVLSDIECVLEKELSETFNSDYKLVLENARQKVRDLKQ